jgi:predicted NAD/FAD-binding protein
MRRVAIIGSGAAGLSAAYHLRNCCAPTLFERDDRFGGHAQTVVVAGGPDAGLPLDVAFMVMNASKYPRMSQMFDELGGIGCGPSEMSFSYCCRVTGRQFSINHDDWTSGRSGRPPSPILIGVLTEIGRFCRHAVAAIAGGRLARLTLAEFLVEFDASDALREFYILPMGAALWSVPPGEVLRLPAELYLRFLDNHGLLTLAAGLRWQHVRGGSRTYVEAVLQAMGGGALRKATAVQRITRDSDGVTVYLPDSKREHFDACIIATHADQALALLGDASLEEQNLLGAIRYQSNTGVLHCDENVMPPESANWASWNYEREDIGESRAVCITYHLNRLQGHRGAAKQYFLTLNRHAPIEEEKILGRLRFEHPMFDLAALDAQRALAKRGMRNHTCFAGSYFGYGFHEDAIASGFAAAEAIRAGTTSGFGDDAP